MKNLELNLIKFKNTLTKYSLYEGSGFSIYGELFKEYISISINPKITKINLHLCKKINEYLLEFENNYSFNELTKSKEFLQLLCFYLSYRNFFKFYKYSTNFTNKLLTIDTENYLDEMGCGIGKPGSGNFAMFYVIIIFNETRDNNDYRINTWFDYMDRHMNSDGFWGKKHITYSLQNGYHQYEIYNYFDRMPPNRLNIKKILKTQDSMGHFGPFSGGGGCYDFDTVDLIYKIKDSNYNNKIDKALSKLYNSLIKEQQKDGGFCESVYISNYKKSILHIFKYTIFNFNIPRLKFFIRTIFSLGGNLILPTHWSQNHRKYNQSDTWNSWFRLLTIYKLKYRLEKKEDKSKIFQFPGIAHK